MRERALERTLHGSGSLDAADDDPDPYGDVDRAVAARPAGWPPGFDRTRPPRVAIVVVGADRSATALARLANEPFPLAIVVPPESGTDALRVARDGGKIALVGCAGADAATLVAVRREGAAGIACSTDDPVRARALVALARGGTVLDDRLDGDALFAAARAARVPALARDVTADAVDDPAYEDFLFAQALAIAERTGTAVVAVHARGDAAETLERFAARAARDGVALVDVSAAGS